MKRIVMLFLWIVSFVLILFYVVYKPEEFLIQGPLILGWVLFTLQFTYNNSEKFYLLIQRIVFNIKNPDCIWNMEVQMTGDFDREIFKKIDELFYSKDQNLKIYDISNTRKIYKLSTISFEISVKEDEGTINISVQDLEVSYRRAKNIIDKELAKIFENLQLSLKPDNNSFGLHVEFKGFNPYFGFFIRRLNASTISSFNITIKIEEDCVAVYKNSIDISTKSFQSLNNLSKDYLAFSPLD
ncbi:MAG: hypothetical protein H0Z35_09000 [Thermoanaerobacteraceae bacterium]|nr:hypothetical protein [Thermoanaerobacteraceae bacterium]